MRLCIHRGTKEIGGNCIEVESSGKHILLDLGMPLTAADPDQIALPDVAGLKQGNNPDFLGIVISHPHQDHYGLLPRVHGDTRIFIGREAHLMLEAAAPFTPSGLDMKCVSHYHDLTPFDVGPFHITPFLIDHSAYDAYAMAIEADGKTLFYTGDFRGHGRKAKGFERLLTQVPNGVDALLLEGTNIGREGEGTDPISERDLEDEIRTSLKSTPGLALAWFSGQNIDRFVTFFRAAKRAGRKFVVDLYIARILDALDRPSLPSPRGPDLRVFLPSRLRSNIIRDQRFDLVKPYYDRRIYPEEIKRQAGNLVMTFRPVMCRDLEKADCLEGARVFYSLWPGYLDRGRSDIRDWCKEHAVDFEILHTSGHAGVPSMQRLVDALKPKRVVPIHSFATSRFEEFFPNVRQAEDGEWWGV